MKFDQFKQYIIDFNYFYLGQHNANLILRFRKNA